MTVFSKAIGIHNQNLHNFRKGKRGLTEEKTILLEKVIVMKYGRLLILEDGDYEKLSYVWKIFKEAINLTQLKLD